MMPSSMKPTGAPSTPEPDRPQPPELLAPPTTGNRRRVDLEAQKRYMDDRFGRDRRLNRRRGA